MLLLLNPSDLTSLISLIFGSSTIVTYGLYRKQQKRLRTAEAFAKEVEALKSTINAMQQQMQYYEGRLTEMQKLIIGKDTYIAQISQDRHTLEIKNAKNKSAINKAYGCVYRSDTHACPVLTQRISNEKDFFMIPDFNSNKSKKN